MSLKKVVKNIKGYISIRIEGYFVERFINLIMNSNIEIWNIKQENVGIIIAQIYAKDFLKIKNIAKKSKCKVKIENKIGVPFTLNKYRHRKIFAILIATVSTIITILNLYVWEVEIIGEFAFPIEEIRQELAEENVKSGVLKKNIDSEKIKLNMLLKREDIAWMGIAIKGNKIIVEIIGKEIKYNDYVKKEPGNIIADKQGVVEKIYVAQGVANVQKGDIIEKGDILISGEVASEFSNTRYVAADGEIIVKTWYVEKYKVPYLKSVVSKSGNKEKSYIIDIFNCEINLLNNSTNFEKYDTIVSSNNFNLFGMLDVPIKVTTQSREEIIVDIITYSKNQAKDLAKSLVKRSIMKKIPSDAKIINEEINIVEYDEGIEAEITIECEEKTGVYQRIGG